MLLTAGQPSRRQCWNRRRGNELQSGELERWTRLYNILNRHANAAEFWYIDRLPAEPVDGRPDLHVHSLEPIAVRLTLSKTF